ncbi:uncharacterized protein LOC131989092 [Centropristis striata]|uniref:uncharacterized protein LOC131989092 n=1 Tax=Centropristis striata TaxID=184440 RepID=UPI0027E18D78|nr:uncharacterized protein LOC131989092 [Centropristis striata]
MSANSSSNSSLKPPTDDCLEITNSLFMSTALCLAYLLLLPLFILVLYMGYRRRRKRPAASATSHSDVFTFHMVSLELISFLGSCFYSYGVYTSQDVMTVLGGKAFSIISPGQTLFHLLTCVERYLAVVHPVTYLGLRQAGGVRIRNICIGCVWLMSFATVGLAMYRNFATVPYFLFFGVCFLVVSFLSISVLCVLIRPGPGEVGGNRDHIDQSKQRAFYTILAIMGTLFARFLSALVFGGLSFTSVLNICDKRFIMWSTAWFYLPSSLVLPLLFLHRAGKLPGCKHNTESV